VTAVAQAYQAPLSAAQFAEVETGVGERAELESVAFGALPIVSVAEFAAGAVIEQVEIDLGLFFTDVPRNQISKLYWSYIAAYAMKKVGAA